MSSNISSDSDSGNDERSFEFNGASQWQKRENAGGKAISTYHLIWKCA